MKLSRKRRRYGVFTPRVYEPIEALKDASTSSSSAGLSQTGCRQTVWNLLGFIDRRVKARHQLSSVLKIVSKHYELTYLFEVQPWSTLTFSNSSCRNLVEPTLKMLERCMHLCVYKRDRWKSKTFEGLLKSKTLLCKCTLRVARDVSYPWDCVGRMEIYLPKKGNDSLSS